MANDFLILLPNIVLALIVFAIFFFIGKTLKRVVRRLTSFSPPSSQFRIGAGAISTRSNRSYRIVYCFVDRHSVHQSKRSSSAIGD
ncbi:MAG: mechanosensitive ion channel family protein [Microcoleus sp.]